MKKILTIALILGGFSPLFSQAKEILVPKEPSGKWLEGNELCIKTMDSVVMKVNFFEMSFNYWIFEIEISNASTTQDVLVDPTKFVVGNHSKTIDMRTARLNCEPSLQRQPFDGVLYGLQADTRRQLKKNTLYPEKTLYGYLVVARCRNTTELRFDLPIENRAFSMIFQKIGG